MGRFCGVCRGCVCFEVCVGFMGCCVCGMRLYVYGVCGMSGRCGRGVCMVYVECVWYVVCGMRHVGLWYVCGVCGLICVWCVWY